MHTITPPPIIRQTGPDRGFTLIELSIVLIIIGLIIGGILIGQELIIQAADRAQITQIEKYNQAVNTFQSKYGGIPGDLSLASATQFGFYTTTCTGDNVSPTGGRNGNGLIEGATSTAPLAALMGENGLFWTDLSQAVLIDSSLPASNTYSGSCSVGRIPSCTCAIGLTAIPGGNGIGNYLPAAKIGYGNFVHVYTASGSNWYDVSAITASLSAGSVITASPTIPVSQAASIDKKVDDGIPTTGQIQAVYVNNSHTNTTLAPNGNPDTASTCYNSSTLAYSTNISNGSGPNCALSIKMQGAAR